MKYVDHFLKFPNQDAYQAVIPESGWPNVTLDPIGAIYRQTGQTTVDENGWPIPEIEETDGYHVNVRVPDGVGLPEPLKPFEIEAPQHPKRVFA